MKIGFSKEAFEDFLYWQQIDKKIFTKISKLLKEIQRDPFHGIGDPEPLKHNWTGYWSRRIDREHRLVYKVENDAIYVAQCRYHY